MSNTEWKDKLYLAEYEVFNVIIYDLWAPIEIDN